MCVFMVRFSLFARNFPHSPHSTMIASFSSSDNLQILSWLFIHETLMFNSQLEHGWCLFSSCTYFVWTFSCPLDASHLEQMLQRDLIFFVGGFGFLTHPGAWVLMCRFNLYLSICFLLHKLQTRDDPIQMSKVLYDISSSIACQTSKGTFYKMLPLVFFVYRHFCSISQILSLYQQVSKKSFIQQFSLPQHV